MILIDTSAWVEYLRGTGSKTARQVRGLLAGDLATTEPVRMEVLAGARDEHHLIELRRLLARASLLRVESGDFEHAAGLYRACRHHGETVRRLIDCLIAAVAIRHDVAIVHADTDFDVLARHTALRLHPQH